MKPSLFWWVLLYSQWASSTQLSLYYSDFCSEKYSYENNNTRFMTRADLCFCAYPNCMRWWILAVSKFSAQSYSCDLQKETNTHKKKNNECRNVLRKLYTKYIINFDRLHVSWMRPYTYKRSVSYVFSTPFHTVAASKQLSLTGSQLRTSLLLFASGTSQTA